MTKHVTLGQWVGGGDTKLDVERLLLTRMLIQANSGNGKSWLLRKLFEVTAGLVQQLIIDPEGEFSTLREQHDLIIVAATGGDALAHPKTAELLARRLLETRASAVLDISELKSHERHSFVRLFLGSLIEAPRSLRHSVLVALDEAQMFAPEKGQGESEASDAVIDVATRGRKRGLCLVAATQRISMFHKAVAAECKNRLIGGTSLDVDVKRAAYDLGLTPKEALPILRAYEPGHFSAFGPAFHQLTPSEFVVGSVETSHPKVGHKQATPPAPTKAILALLPQLADLPKEAEQQAKTMEDLRRELAQVRRELTLAKKEQPAPGPSPQDLAAAHTRGHKAGFEAAAIQFKSTLRALRGEALKALDEILRGDATGPVVWTQPAAKPQQIIQKSFTAPAPVARALKHEGNGDVPPSVRKIVDVIHRSYPVSLSFEAAARRAAISSRSSAYRTYRAAVAASDELEEVDGKYRSRPEFAANAPVGSDAPLSEWVGKLPPAYGKMLSAIHEHGPIDKEQVADLAGVSKTSSGLGTGLRELQSLQLVVERNGQYEVEEGLR